MTSTFGEIELGKRGLMAHSKAIATVGHNLSNASTPGYSRQRVIISASDPLYVPGLNRPWRPGQVGTGAEVARIERMRDALLDRQIIADSDALAYWETRKDYLYEVDRVYQETKGNSVRKTMDEFWHSWQNLAEKPDVMDARQEVLERGKSLMNHVNLRFERLDSIRRKLNDDIGIQVQEVNSLIRNIAEVNREIVRSEALGDTPNDLYDRRGLLVDDLSSYLSITVDPGRDPDEFQVHTGGMHLVQGSVASTLAAVGNPANEGFSDVVWNDNPQELLRLDSGSLASLVELRDTDLREEIQKLDKLALNYASLVNDIHRDAYGLDGSTGTNFFRAYPFTDNAQGNFDADNDGAFDQTRLFMVKGSTSLDPNRTLGFNGTITLSGSEGNIAVPYTQQDRVHDVINRINHSGAEVTARIGRDGNLELRATESALTENPDFVIRHVEDDGYFLTTYSGVLQNSGPEGAFDYGAADATVAFRDGETAWETAVQTHPSEWLAVNPEIENNLAAIASGFADNNGEPAPLGDNRAAIAIADLVHQHVLDGVDRTFGDFFADSVASIGAREKTAKLAFDTYDQYVQELTNLRSDVSGVNVDEEFSNLIKFQHGYNAAARFVTTVDRLLDTIINRLGV